MRAWRGSDTHPDRSSIHWRIPKIHRRSRGSETPHSTCFHVHFPHVHPIIIRNEHRRDQRKRTKNLDLHHHISLCHLGHFGVIKLCEMGQRLDPKTLQIVQTPVRTYILYGTIGPRFGLCRWMTRKGLTLTILTGGRFGSSLDLVLAIERKVRVKLQLSLEDTVWPPQKATTSSISRRNVLFARLKNEQEAEESLSRQTSSTIPLFWDTRQDERLKSLAEEEV